MGFDDLMMKHEGNEMNTKQTFEIVKRPNIKRGKTVKLKIEMLKRTEKARKDTSRNSKLLREWNITGGRYSRLL